MSEIEEKIKQAEASGQEVNLSEIAPQAAEHHKVPVATGINPRKVRYYTPEFLKSLPKDQWPVFHLKPKGGIGWQTDMANILLSNLDSKQIESLEDLVGMSSTEQLEYSIKLSGRTTMILKLGLVGWTNYLDDEGDPIPFEATANGPTDDTINSLSPGLAMDLATALAKGLKLTKEERLGLKL